MITQEKKSKKLPKRNPRTYKCIDKVYKNAMRRAKKENTSLANVIERFVDDYSNGNTYIIYKIHSPHNPTA